MEIHKTLIELMGYAIHVNDTTIVPIRIDADDSQCEVEFSLVSPEQEITPLLCRGRHENFIFTTQAAGVPISVNLKTGILKKIRIHPDED